MNNHDSAQTHDLTEVQKRLLEMLAWFHEFCTSNNLRYYIIEGTVIGAARHQGFIPWDDDVDVGMPRKDYNRMISLLVNQNGIYRLESPYSQNNEYIYPWCKLFDTRTTKIERMRKDYRFGIYIDVFPLDGLGNTYEESFRYYRRIDFLNMFWATRVCAIRRDRSLVKNASIVISRCIPDAIINIKKLIVHIDRVSSKKDFDTEEYVSCTLSSYRSKEIMKKEIYGQPRLYKFEDIVAFGPEKSDEYLKTIYGEWNVLPPIKDRVNHHDYLYLNLDEPYISFKDDNTKYNY